MYTALKASDPIKKAYYVKSALKLVSKNDDELKQILINLTSRKNQSKEFDSRKVKTNPDEKVYGSVAEEEENGTED